jgi:hypothetical protein
MQPFELNPTMVSGRAAATERMTAKHGLSPDSSPPIEGASSSVAPPRASCSAPVLPNIRQFNGADARGREITHAPDLDLVDHGQIPWKRAAPPVAGILLCAIPSSLRFRIALLFYDQNEIFRLLKASRT